MASNTPVGKEYRFPTLEMKQLEVRWAPGS